MPTIVVALASTYICNGALRRDPSGYEDSHIQFELNTGTPWDDVVMEYVNSTEAQTVVYPILRAYQGYFGRVPDSSGLTYWTQVFRDNTANFFGGVYGKPSLVSATNSWEQSAEFQSKYGSLSNSDFITQLYVNLYARSPDSSGLAFWTNVLDSNAETRAQVMIDFTEADEFKTRSNYAIQQFLRQACYFNAGAGDSPYQNQSLV